MALENQSSLDTLKQNLFDYVQLQLGSQIIDLELDAEHYEAAYQRTIGVYRQRAQNAYEESYSFLELVTNVNIYDMPQEVITVRAYVVNDSKQLPPNYEAMVAAVKTAGYTPDITGVIDRFCQVKTTYHEDDLLTEFDFSFRRLITN
jgi:hypothetical protein